MPNTHQGSMSPKHPLIFHPVFEIQQRLEKLYAPHAPLDSKAVYGLCRENFFLLEEILAQHQDIREGLKIELLPINTLPNRILDLLEKHSDIVLTDPNLIPLLETLPKDNEEEAILFVSSLCNFSFGKPLGSFFFGGRASSLHRFLSSQEAFEAGPWSSVTVLVNQESDYKALLKQSKVPCSQNLVWYGPFTEQENFRNHKLENITHVAEFYSPEQAALNIIPCHRSGFTKVSWLVRKSSLEQLEQMKSLLAGLGIFAELHHEPCKLSLNPQDFAQILQGCPDREWILRCFSVLFQKFLSWKYSDPLCRDFTP
jgi:hypothetical protein